MCFWRIGKSIDEEIKMTRGEIESVEMVDAVFVYRNSC